VKSATGGTRIEAGIADADETGATAAVTLVFEAVNVGFAVGFC
jgi:hypothetical protein